MLLVGIAATDSLLALTLMAGLMAAFSAVFDPVEAALEPELLPTREVQIANVFRTGALQILAIVGPAIASALLLAVTTSAVLLVNAASYLISGVLIASLPRRTGRTEIADRQPWTVELREGAAFVAHAPDLRYLFAASAVVFLLLGMQGPLFFAFTLERFGSGRDAFGILMAALGVGSLVGVYLLARLGSRLRKPLTVLYGILAIDATSLFAFTYGHTLLTCAIWMALMGLISSFFTVIVRTYLQTIPPVHMRSRVLGWYWAMYSPLVVASLALGTWLTHAHGAIVILQGAAAAEMIAAAGLSLIMWWRTRKARRSF